MTLCASLILIAALFLPIWRIDLSAPQYPEGLSMKIFAGKLAGDVEVINGLNHYIGMKTMHTEDFIEFRILPWLIGGLSLIGVLVALAGKRRLFYMLVLLFLLIACLAMADFYRWEYNYGHNLDPAAAIRIPDMAYQPPLIGFKQLLNFGAWSFPDLGGWVFAGSGALLVLAALLEWRMARKKKLHPGALACMAIGLLLQACSVKPSPIQPGADACLFCRMAITDLRFACEIVNKKGKAFKFDDLHCLNSYIKTGGMGTEQIAGIYLADYTGIHEWIKKENAFFLSGEALHSPMGSNTAAFSRSDSLNRVKQVLGGTEKRWEELQ